mgnify:CR=1 FL=1
MLRFWWPANHVSSSLVLTTLIIIEFRLWLEYLHIPFVVWLGFIILLLFVLFSLFLITNGVVPLPHHFLLLFLSNGLAYPFVSDTYISTGSLNFLDIFEKLLLRVLVFLYHHIISLVVSGASCTLSLIEDILVLILSFGCLRAWFRCNPSDIVIIHLGWAVL